MTGELYNPQHRHRNPSQTIEPVPCPTSNPDLKQYPWGPWTPEESIHLFIPGSTASLPHFLPYLFDLCHSPSLCHSHAEWRGPFKRLPDRDLRAKALMCLLFMLQHICGKKHKQVVPLLFFVVRFPMNAYYKYICMTGHSYMRSVKIVSCSGATSLQSKVNHFCYDLTKVKWK